MLKIRKRQLIQIVPFKILLSFYQCNFGEFLGKEEEIFFPETNLLIRKNLWKTALIACFESIPFFANPLAIMTIILKINNLLIKRQAQKYHNSYAMVARIQWHTVSYLQ